MSVFRGKAAAVRKEEKVVKEKVGNWIAMQLQYQDKTIVIINVYRLPSSLPNRSSYCLTQYNILEGKVKGINEYRKEIFQQIKQYLENDNTINDIIIAGNFNQNINSNEIKKFFAEIGVENVHSRINNIIVEDLDRTYIHGSKLIDTIAASEDIIEFIEGCWLLY